MTMLPVVYEGKSVEISPIEIQRDLPSLLLDALERRLYEDFDRLDLEIANHAGGTLDSQSRFLHIREVRHGPDQELSFHPYNMQNVISSLMSGKYSLIYAIRSDKTHLRLFMGLRQSPIAPEALPASRQIQVLERALRSNYPGIVIEANQPEPDDFAQHVLLPLTESNLVAMTGIPSLRGEKTRSSLFTQSIDRLVDALRGEEYTLLILAEPISDSRINEMIRQLRVLGEEVHRVVRQSIQVSENVQRSTSEGASDTVSISGGINPYLAALFSFNLTKSSSRSITTTAGTTTGRAVTQELLNKTAQFCEQVLDHYTRRLQTGRNLGFWTTGVYLSSHSENTFLRLQGIARSLFSGEATHFEPFRTVNLTRLGKATEALYYLHNPVIVPTPDVLPHPLSTESGREFETLATPLTTEELAVLMSLPHREVPGLKLSPVADFNLNPPSIEGFELGHLLYRGEKLANRVAVSAKSLTRHTFVTGLTGSGKTNTCLALLADAYKNRQLKFLVIDPAKTEYRFLLHAPVLGDDLLLFTLGDELTAPFRLNPFEFVPDFPLLTHIDLLKAVFNAAFPMYASMPYLLEEALIAIYRERGWDITKSSNRYVDPEDLQADYTLYLPRLSDLYAKIDEVVASKRYDVRLTLDLTAALKARLGSLLRGGKGLMLDTQRSTPIAELLNRPVVLELQSIGDDDEKAFVMALIFVMLYEAGRSRPVDGQLQHVTLIEEAHRLLRNVPMSIGAESANPRGKTVEMFTDMMAEMRARGEGFIVVDQMPGKLVPDVIKGSNLKIVHRLMAQDDRQAVGSAMGMIPFQVDYLPRLTVGQAVVHSEELEEACLVQIDPVEDELADQRPGSSPQEKEQLTNQRLRDKVGLFYASQRQIFHRYYACQLCDAPCTYYDSDVERHWDQVLDLAARFITVMAVGQPGVINALWHHLNDELNRTLHLYRPQAAGEAGHARCLRVVLAAEAARRFHQLYPRADYTKAALELQLRLARLWESWPPEAQVLSDLRILITKGIATAPVRPRPGCAHCPARCWFGHRFQIDNHPAVQSLAGELKAAPAGQKLGFEKIITLALRAFGTDIQPSLHAAAAYCLLSQATANESLLADFRHRAFTPKP